METFSYGDIEVHYVLLKETEAFVRTPEGPYSIFIRDPGGILPPPFEEDIRAVLEALRHYLWPKDAA